MNPPDYMLDPPDGPRCETCRDTGRVCGDCADTVPCPDCGDLLAGSL